MPGRVFFIKNMPRLIEVINPGIKVGQAVAVSKRGEEGEHVFRVASLGPGVVTLVRRGSPGGMGIRVGVEEFMFGLDPLAQLEFFSLDSNPDKALAAVKQSAKRVMDYLSNSSPDDGEVKYSPGLAQDIDIIRAYTPLKVKI